LDPDFRQWLPNFRAKRTTTPVPKKLLFYFIHACPAEILDLQQFGFGLLSKFAQSFKIGVRQGIHGPSA